MIVRVQPGARADATAHAQLRMRRTPAAAPPVGRRAVAARAGPCALQALPHRLWGSGRSGQPAEKHAETATNLHLVLCRAHPERCGCPAAVCAKTTAPGMPQEPRRPGALGLPVPACREAAPRPLTLRGQRGGPRAAPFIPAAPSVCHGHRRPRRHPSLRSSRGSQRPLRRQPGQGGGSTGSPPSAGRGRRHRPRCPPLGLPPPRPSRNGAIARPSSASPLPSHSPRPATGGNSRRGEEAAASVHCHRRGRSRERVCCGVGAPEAAPAPGTPGSRSRGRACQCGGRGGRAGPGETRCGAEAAKNVCRGAGHGKSRVGAGGTGV